MSSPILVPDGSVRMIPNEQIDAAMSSGGKRVVRMSDPSGTPRWIPQESVPDALKAGAKPFAAQTNYSSMSPQDLAAQAMRNSGISQPPNARPVPSLGYQGIQPVQPSAMGAAGNAAASVGHEMFSPSGSIGRFHKAFEQDLGGAIQGVGGLAKAALSDPSGNPAYGMANAMVAPVVQSANDPNQSKAETLGVASGVNSAGIKQGAQNQDYSTILGHSALPLVTAMMAGRNATPERTPVSPAEANANLARIVTDTVNPPPKAMTKFESNVQAQLPEVLQGKPAPQTRAELMNAFKQSADTAKQAYYENLVNPAKDVQVSTNYIPNYGGSTVTHGTATVAQLDARLADINADLRQYYEKGGEAARASLSGSKSPAELSAEAAFINKEMNAAISKKTGVPVEQVSAGRKKFGQMYDVADKMQLALNQERFARNAADKQPISLDSSATGVALRQLSKAKDNAIGMPADRAVRKALR